MVSTKDLSKKMDHKFETIETVLDSEDITENKDNSSIPKRWRITLKGSRSYKSPKYQKTFVKDVPVDTHNEDLVKDCKLNSSFYVQELN